MVQLWGLYLVWILPNQVSDRNMRWITTTQVLEDLRDSNDSEAWRIFCEHFQPVLINFARGLGLSPADAEDATQETMVAFLKAFKNGKYDRQKGRLSDWLFGVAKRVILNLRGHMPLEKLVADETTGTSFWDLIQDDTGLKHSWETQWRQMVLTACLQQARCEFDPKVFEAFQLYALNETPADKVAQQLGVSRNAVYIAKSRILSRLRKLERQFE
jgi:RNA polymerase sigma-70 factor (ECF subfamily)